jgi:hypothetical protein
MCSLRATVDSQCLDSIVHICLLEVTDVLKTARYLHKARQSPDSRGVQGRGELRHHLEAISLHTHSRRLAEAFARVAYSTYSPAPRLEGGRG